MAASVNGSSPGGASTADIIVRAEALFDDLSFTSAREWKAAAPGRKVVGVPIKLSDTPGSVRTAPPLLGQHTEAILEELGFSTDDVDRLRRGNII